METHVPVLIDSVLDVLSPQVGDNYLDLTAGYGGHAAAVTERIGKSGQAWLYDQDETAVSYLRAKFETQQNVIIGQENFSEIDLGDLPRMERILMDLGVSSPQLDEAQRGFSFMREPRLDMRMDRKRKLDAYEIVNTYDEKKLADIFYRYGEERQSRRLAKAICEARRVRPIATTTELASLIEQNIGRKGKLHPATRVFQALRIAVNDELTALETVLPRLTDKLSPGGRLAVITFHSLEDRLVKQHFKSLTTLERDQYGASVGVLKFKLVTKRPIKGSVEDRNNPRSRSAKLRAIEKIK